MQIELNLKIFIFILIFLFTGQLEIYGILMIFALIHEIGHMIIGILLRFKPSRLRIIPFGFNISFNTYCEDYNKKVVKANILILKKLLIAMAGPITNLIIALIVYVLKINNSEIIVYSNLLIAIFNLIPIYPLDGGRIIKYIINIFLGRRKAFYYSNLISNIVISIATAISSIAIIYYKNIAILFVLIYLWAIVIMENKKYKIKKKIYDIIL